MGYGGYNSVTRSLRSSSMGYDTKSAQEIFSKSANSKMNPRDVDVRESMDSKEHPNSVPIVLGLDVTGSMGSIPHFLVKEGLPKMMDKIIKGGVADPQVLFLGIGDHECDTAPLQVGQFESSDALLDHWLTSLWIEGNGGGNGGESYLLAWYFAAFHTKIDSWDKRKKKGLVFTIGDEPTLNKLPVKSLKTIMGNGQFDEMTAKQLLKKAEERYEVYHLHMMQGSNGKREDVQEGWKKLLGDHVIMVDHREEVGDIIAKKVIEIAYATPDTKRFADLT